MPIKVAIAGAGGRMGRRLLALADADPDFILTQAIEWNGFPLIGKGLNDGQALAPRAAGVVWTSGLAADADVLVDFSSPDGTAANAAAAAGFGIAMVVGTTGLDVSHLERLREAARRIPVLRSPNFSPGVNLMFKLAAEAAGALGDGYDIEIVEAHHNQKIDAPSGTALGLARAVAEPLGRDVEKDVAHGRVGKPGKRPAREIGMHAIRMGSVTGDHTVYFCDGHECFSISHRAESRDVFAAGALRAAKWLKGKAPGLYAMDDLLFA